jgi:hypothetical protein
VSCDCLDFEADALTDWLVSRYGDRELARRLLGMSDLRFSRKVEAELLEALSALGAVAVARELVRNASSLEEFPDYAREVPAPPAGALVRWSRGPSRRMVLGGGAR